MKDLGLGHSVVSSVMDLMDAHENTFWGNPLDFADGDNHLGL